MRGTAGLSAVPGTEFSVKNKFFTQKFVLALKFPGAVRMEFNMEMQNDTENDDVRKRARFYQGLIDTPVLKAGKKTKYKHLPSTVIIFITQEDIFGKNRAMYTFTEQCEEIPGLALGDGTRKIFLNMSSKEGRAEVISLMQYMKDTRLSNPDIVVPDERIQRLDEIVQEVKQSEEWEAVNMSIAKAAMERGEIIGREIGERRGLEIGERRGEEIGEKLGLIKQIIRKLQKGKTPEEISEDLETDLELVSSLCISVQKYAPKYDVKAIYEDWKQGAS